MDSTNKNIYQEIDHPLLKTLGKIARRFHVPTYLYDYCCMWLLQIPQLHSVNYDKEGYSVHRALENQCLAMASCREMVDLEQGVQLFFKRFKQGAIAYVVLDNSQQVVGYAHVSCKENLLEDDERYYLNCNSKQAYIFDTFLHPDARGKNVYGLLISSLAEDLKATQRRDELFVLVDQSNLRSLKAHKKLGGELKETCCYITVLGICHYTIRSFKKRSCLRRFHTNKYCKSLFLNGE